ALPGSAALAFEEQRWTYRDLDHVARCVATRLVRAGAQDAPDRRDHLRRTVQRHSDRIAAARAGAAMRSE
ncbi:hypothetical protein, partial [Pseudomonas aeruginosa]